MSVDLSLMSLYFSGVSAVSVDVSLELSQDEVVSVALVGRPIICTNCRNFSRRGHRRCSL